MTVPSAPPGAVPPPTGVLRRALRSRVGGLPTAFWWLWVGTLVNRAGGFVQPFLVLYLTGPRDLTVPQSGLVLAAFGAGVLVSQPVGGVLTDRVGRRATMVGGLAATGVLLGALGAARGFGPITVAALLLGCVSDVYRPASTAVIADVLEEQARPRAYALQFWAVNLGFSVASVLGGLLAAHGYTLLFVVDALTCLVFAALVGWRVPETRPVRDPDLPRPRFEGVRAVGHDRLLQAAIALIFLYAVLYNQVYTVLPLYTRDIGLGTSAYGLAVALNGVAIIVLQPLLLPVFDRVPRTWLLPASLTLVGGGIALTGLVSNLSLLMATVVVWSIGEIGFSGSIQALVTTLAPEHLRGRYVGATGLAWGGSVLLGPLAGTAVYAHHPAVLWWGCLGTGVVAAVGYAFLGRAVERRQLTTAAPDGDVAATGPAVPDRLSRGEPDRA
ncbi:MDR family MFS transporter [Jatrophihabitans sp. YIM 134969]